MRYILFLLLICSTVHAQTYRAATTTSTSAPISYNKAGVDTLIAQLTRRVQALESRVVFLRPGTVDSLNRLSILLNELSTRIAQQGASLSTLNATLAGNIATDRSQEIQLTNLYVAINWAREEAAEAQKAAQAAQDMINQVKQYLKALP